MSHSTERQAQKTNTQHQLDQAQLMLEIEREVMGCDYGASSWTTRDEAGQIGRLLDLDSGKRLLDVGAGSGWPGLFLAHTTGCDVALVDIPLEELRVASERAAKDRLSGGCWLAVGDGTALPFRSGAFDAICHSDVLC